MKQHIFPFLLILPLCAESILEEQITEGNRSYIENVTKESHRRLKHLRQELSDCYEQAQELWQNDETEDVMKALLAHINALKEEIQEIEANWRERAVAENEERDLEKTPWDQEEISLFQFVIEYGSQDHLYLIPPDVAAIKVNISSTIPIPRASWTELLEIVLEQYGIGVKVLSPCIRSLYIVKQEPYFSAVIATSPKQLAHLPERSRVFFVFSPPPEQCKSSLHFFERFTDTRHTFVYGMGTKIVIVSSKKEIEKLLALHDTVWKNALGKTVRAIPVSKISVKEMERLLLSFFGEMVDKIRTFNKPEGESLHIIALEQGNVLVCIGPQDVVERTEKIVHDIENQLQDPAEMMIFTYHCKHSSPEDLTKILEKVYLSLVTTSEPKETEISYKATNLPSKPSPEGYPPALPLVVAPEPIKPQTKTTIEMETGTSEHFIPDPKTGTILMVVRREVCTKIKELLKKLDIPKRMVQIEILLFEKRLHSETNFGLNLLKIGSQHNGVRFQTNNAPHGSGVLQYVLHHGKSHAFPAYDYIMSLLMTQEDIQLNEAPSMITVNQTPVVISLVEEISINNGAAPIDTNKGIAFEKSYTRAQYGTTISVTPIIHLAEEEIDDEEKGFVTLKTNITFDTTRPSSDDRPLVDRRHIENEVRILDGQTVILGGMRRKTSEDHEDRIPFLGDIPGIGKLFGSTRLLNHNTEMFIFITPKIILDPKEELLKIREQELKRRPGEIPEFLEKLQEAFDKERKCYFAHALEHFYRT